MPESEELDRWEKTMQGPELYINEEDLQKAYNQPICNLWDFVRFIFNPQRFRLPTKEERILRQYDGFVRRYNLCEDQRDVLLKLSKIYVANNRIPEEFFHSPMVKGFIGYSKKEAEALFVDKGGRAIKSFYEGVEIKWEMREVMETQGVANVSQSLHSAGRWKRYYKPILQFLRELYNRD